MSTDPAVELSDDLLQLLRSGATCYVATTMPDGSPQLTQTWVDVDATGSHVLVNTVATHQKTRNIARDPRVSLAVSDPADPSRYHEIRGRVVSTTTEGAVDHIEALSQRYTAQPYPWYGGRDQQRVIVEVEPTRIHTMG
ncbi:PPOX class F420-dependent oxidoreductase [Nocardioides hwasunensis]|uniref:PPOX class F420-dependent oxidoreductase n=1 Tax=Nocardioides hwasunensis TaxID=397258 RepID=A0ABR8MLQ3_9ACTN|nr:PPOX class F420-dependent oxidoreductase [Nocardioides hwasunensis]MBD3916495.1 PPOX class F420-dependent oxidoreductase [Nocardioides hwasunensis]